MDSLDFPGGDDDDNMIINKNNNNIGNVGFAQEVATFTSDDHWVTMTPFTSSRKKKSEGSRTKRNRNIGNTNTTMTANRRRRRLPDLAFKSSSSSSVASNSSSSNITSSATSSRANEPSKPIIPKVQVKKNVGIYSNITDGLQDSGSSQMVHDECLYLCSTINSTKNPQDALEAAINLAQLLSNRRTRSMLWKKEKTRYNSKKRDVVRDNLNQNKMIIPTTTTSSSTPTTTTANSSSFPILQSVLQVLSFGALVTQKDITNRGSWDSDSMNRMSLSSSSSSSSGANTFLANNKNKAINSKFRTRTARQKEATQQSLASTMSSFSSMSYNMKQKFLQALTCSWFFLSMDCTLSHKYSVATAASYGRSAQPAFAKKIRTQTLRHAKALQGLVQLVIVTDSVFSIANDDSSQCLSSSAASPLQILPQPLDIRASPVSSHDYKNSNNFTEFALPAVPVPNSSVSPSTTDSKLDQQQPTVPVDPTAAGRRRRKRKRQIKEQTNGSNDENLDFQPMSNHKVQQAKSADRSSLSSSSAAQLSFRGGSSLSPPSSVMSSLSPNLSPSKQRNKHSQNHQDNVRSSLDSDISSISGASKTSTMESDVKLQTLCYKIGMRCDTTNDINKKNENRSCASSSSGDGAYDDSNENTTVSEAEKAMWVAITALESLNRILTGKNGDEMSCLDHADVESDEQDDMQQYNSDGDDADNENNPISADTNPLVRTNTLLAESGSIPLLAKAMIDSLQAVITYQQQSQKKRSKRIPSDIFFSIDSKLCNACFKHLRKRISLLSTIIDGACLWNDANREGLCNAMSDPFTFQRNDSSSNINFDHDNNNIHDNNLVPTLIRFIDAQSTRLDFLLPIRPKEEYVASPLVVQEATSDMFLAALRTLTSLTHENSLAATQLITQVRQNPNDDHEGCGASTANLYGLQILSDLLYQLQQNHNNNSQTKSNPGLEKHRYDATIFCLTTFANVAETNGEAVQLLMELDTPDKQQRSWLQWLCQWLKRQTQSFQDAVVGNCNAVVLDFDNQQHLANNDDSSNTGSQSSIGSPLRNTKRELKKQEEDRLVAAGNCCVLLACLLLPPENNNNHQLKRQDENEGVDGAVSEDILETARTLIINEMPGKRLDLIINTMQAFCNFYRLSLGAVSVAVVAPVQKLIVGLQQLQNKGQELAHER